MFNKLKILGLSFVAIVGGLVPHINRDFSMVSAESESEYTSTTVNWGGSPSYGGPYSWEYISPTYSHVNYYSYNSNNPYTRIELLKEHDMYGKEIFGQYYDDFEDASKETYSGSGNYYYANQLMDSVHVYNSNINLLLEENRSINFVISYQNGLFASLKNLYSVTNQAFTIPCLWFDTEPFALLKVDSTGINLLTLDRFVLNVSLSVSENTFIDAGNNRHNIGYVYFDLTFKYLSDKQIINEIHYLSNDTSDWSYHPSLYFDGTNANYFLPYQVSYFDYQRGEIGLGHSIYGDVYGTGSPSKILTSILFENDSYGVSTYYWTLMTSSDYNTYIDTSTEFFETPGQILGKFAYAPRPLSDNETGGSGGLVWQPYCWYLNYDITRSSQIKIKSLTFATPGEHSLFVDDASDLKTYNLSDELFVFNYFCDKAIGHCSTEMYEMNIDTGGNKRQSNPFWNAVANILLPGVGALANYISNSVYEANANRGLNIQRLYFNIKDSYNQLIPNVTKIQFKYQMGKKDIIKDVNNDGTLEIGKYSDLPVSHMEANIQDVTTETISSTFYNTSHETNGFISIEDDPQVLVSDTGISNSYSYYYQNVYQTKDYQPDANHKAYFNHICYFSMMSIWYETYEGQTIRLTTDKDGYYLTTDNHGREIVMNINDSDNPSGMTVSEFLSLDNEDNTDYNYSNGSETTGDKNIDAWEDFWGDVGDALAGLFTQSDFFKIILIIAGCVGGIILIIFAIRFFRFLFGNGNKRSNRRRRK